MSTGKTSLNHQFATHQSAPPFYLYSVSNEFDFSKDTNSRRLSKMKQGNHPGFLFNLENGEKMMSSLFKFAGEFAQTCDGLQLSLVEFEKFGADLVQIFKGPIFIKILNYADYLRGFDLLKMPNVNFVIKCLSTKCLNQILCSLKTIDEDQRIKISVMPEVYNPEQGQKITAKDYLGIIKDKQATIQARKTILYFMAKC